MHTSGWVWYREADDTHAREDNARLRSVLGHCPKRIAVLDENGNLVGFNGEFAALFPSPPPLGEPIGQLFDERPRAMLAEVVALAGTKQRAGAIISMHTTVGAEHELEFLAATLPSDGMRTIGVVMAADDRTGRTHEEAERSALARDIDEANCNRAIDLAQSAMCHDINNVLSALTFTLSSLRERCGTADSEVCAMLGELDEAVTHGGALVASVSRNSKVAVVRSESADVRDCVRRAAEIVASIARNAKVTIAICVLNDARVPLGGTKLTQVLTNLLTNSVHAIQDARRPGRIDVTVECATPETVTLCVRDNGVGIEPSRLVDSFEAFETTRAALGGTGLGLAIAREIIEGAGGHIDVMSTPGCATEMRLELPATQCAQRISTVA